VIERIADTATHGTDRAILLQRMVFIKNFSGILRREVTDIGFDAEYNVLGQLIIVAGHCPKDHAVSGVLGVTVIVVAKEVDGPQAMSSAKKTTDVPSTPIVYWLVVLLPRISRVWL